jgi:GNAT superfamily N-acetyltransferase
VSGYLIRQADDADVSRVAELWTAAARDLAARGYDQWQYPVRVASIQKAVDAGTCWVIDDKRGLAATVTLDEDADPALWRPEDQPGDALYVHRLVVRTDLRGQDLGSAILDWAGDRAADLGKGWLRLDAWTTNPDLHRYYLNQNFHHIRTVHAAGIVSGALFQREAAATLPHGQDAVDAIIGRRLGATSAPGC